jgi:hypothetical protein
MVASLSLARHWKARYDISAELVSSRSAMTYIIGFQYDEILVWEWICFVPICGQEGKDLYHSVETEGCDTLNPDMLMIICT